MATKSKSVAAVAPLEQVYNEHNHESARDADAEKQCQCKHCKAHRDALTKKEETPQSE